MTDNTKSHSVDIEFGSLKQTNLGLSGMTAIVHKTNEEGGLLIDAISGVVIPGQSEAPEWASGFACALLAERHGFYTKRLGEAYAAEHQNPEAYNADDLGWVALDDEGQEVEVPASDEYRQNVVKSVLISKGIIQDIEEVQHNEFAGSDSKWQTVAEETLSLDRERTQEEASAIDTAATSGFQPVSKTGTSE